MVVKGNCPFRVEMKRSESPVDSLEKAVVFSDMRSMLAMFLKC